MGNDIWRGSGKCQAGSEPAVNRAFRARGLLGNLPAMGSSRTTTCPHECVDPLLERIRMNDQEDPPGSPHAEKNARRRHLHWPHPSRDQLEHILEVVHAASLQPEEGVTAGFSIAFVSPEGAGRRCDVVLFATPRTFDRRAVAKLAPAVDPDRTFLGVFPG